MPLQRPLRRLAIKEKSSIDHASTPTSSTTSKKDLKSLSDCESKDAKNGGLTQAQVDDCYNQLFPREKVSQTLKSTPTQGQQSTSPLDQTLQSTPTQGQQSTPTKDNSQLHAKTTVNSNARTTVNFSA